MPKVVQEQPGGEVVQELDVARLVPAWALMHGQAHDAAVEGVVGQVVDLVQPARQGADVAGVGVQVLGEHHRVRPELGEDQGHRLPAA